MKIANYRFISLLIALLIGVSSMSLKAQDEQRAPFKGHLYLTPNVGLSQYFGDLNKDDFFNKDQKLGFGGILGYQISPVFGIRAQVLKTNLYSTRDDLKPQQLKLETNLLDAGLNLTVNINEIFAKYNEKRFINLYLFGGAGYTFYTSDYTEGGVPYTQSGDKVNELIIPIGAGASFRLSRMLALNLEYGDHMTLNDDKMDGYPSMDGRDHYSYASLGLQIKFMGKPDRDKDGIVDAEDLCPDVFGKKELAGCPDKDNDGIADKDDACVDVAGKAEFKGCPDTDGDGIADKDDACPTVFGKKDLKGCPDADNDGIADKDDKCPNDPGKKELGGCPDRDGDGIADKNDACPDVKGIARFEGCPDFDNDGIPDSKDKCPEVAGTVANNGCPEAPKVVETVQPTNIIKKVVYFNTDQSVVLQKSIVDLNEVIAFMNQNPTAKLAIAGFTDIRESHEYNMKLSERRADYVENFLKKKINSKVAIDKAFFGENNPAADNNTPEGMALNRRVEITITK